MDDKYLTVSISAWDLGQRSALLECRRSHERHAIKSMGGDRPKIKRL